MADYIDWFGDGSVAVLDVALACCAVETSVATPDHAPRSSEPAPGAKVVIVVAGTVTDALAPLVKATIDRAVATHPGARVVSFGACSCTGGPYWDSYAVTKGVDQLVPVDHYIAGCPPPPDSLASYIEEVRRG